ncbi:MAG: hypothetical protein PHS77_13400 [Gallionellaceae bacterium]|nr:hypothetical protein [Gallionellaceae bacterium]
MSATRLLALALLLCPLPLAAQEIDLGASIPPGKWAMAYQRTGEFKPLRLKHKENGTSYTCIAGDPRSKIVSWIAGKGCSIERETLADGIYRLEGECRLKWWKSQAVPVRVELRPESATRFSLDIQTLDNNLLGYSEHTEATLQGPCDAPAAKPATAAAKGAHT